MSRWPWSTEYWCFVEEVHNLQRTLCSIFVVDFECFSNQVINIDECHSVIVVEIILTGWCIWVDSQFLSAGVDKLLRIIVLVLRFSSPFVGACIEVVWLGCRTNTWAVNNLSCVICKDANSQILAKYILIKAFEKCQHSISNFLTGNTVFRVTNVNIKTDYLLYKNAKKWIWS